MSFGSFMYLFKEGFTNVWVNRLIDDVYHGDFDPGKYAGFAGYVQQLQFYHYRNKTFNF